MHNSSKKAAILARGLGTRMRASESEGNLSEEQKRIAAQGTKTLMPILGDKTMLDLIIGNLNAAGFTELCLVIGPEHVSIREYCAKRDLDVAFAVQTEPLGTADAVRACEGWIQPDELFLVVNSDNLYPTESLRRLRATSAPGLLGFEREGLIRNSNIPADRIAKFATLNEDETGHLTHIVEKPDAVEKDSLVSMNAWLFSPVIFEACRSIELSIRGEYEIATAVQYAIDRLDERFMITHSSEGVLDLSSRADIQNVRYFLERN